MEKEELIDHLQAIADNSKLNLTGEQIVALDQVIHQLKCQLEADKQPED